MDYNTDALVRHILSCCLVDSFCMRELVQENLEENLFEDYQEYYVLMKKNFLENFRVFNFELFCIENSNKKHIEIISSKLLETDNNTKGFTKLIKRFKEESFKSKLNKNINIAKMLIETGSTSDLKKAYAISHEEINLHKNEVSDGNSIKELASKYDLNKKREYISMGYHALSHIKMEKTDFVLIGARPSIGKTAFLTNLIRTMGLKSSLISLEMNRDAIFDRFLPMYSKGVSMEKIRNNDLTDIEKEKVNDGLRHIYEKLDINIVDDCGFSFDAIKNSIVNEVKKGAVCIYVDHLHLIKGDAKSQNKNNEVSDISRDFKELAKELRTPIILLCQLSRGVEQRSDKRPLLSDLRDSGSLEQDADIILFLYRDSYYIKAKETDTTFEVDTAKNRQGETKRVYLDYLRHIQYIQSREK